MVSFLGSLFESKDQYLKTSIYLYILLATINPIALVVLSVIYTVKNGFAIHYHLVEGVLFAASVFVYYNVFYNNNTLPYAVYYTLVTAVFAFLVQMFKKQ